MTTETDGNKATLGCMKKRGITENDLIEGATPAGGAALVEWLSNGSPSVTY